MLALAQACSMLADALRKYASLSEDEIIRGLTAMGGALLEFSAVLSILNKFAGGKALFGAEMCIRDSRRRIRLVF